MADLFSASRPEPSGPGRYEVVLDPEWDVWGPMGGYLAVVALRAMAAEAALPRPSSFAMQFLRVARFAALELEVEKTKPGRAAEALRVRARQEGRDIFDATAWFSAADLPGFVHAHGDRPSVPAPSELAGFADLAPNYDEWYPIWRRIEGRPTRWYDGPENFEPGPPVWHTWMRLGDPVPSPDPVLDASRSLLWLDTMMWNAIHPAHPPPPRFVAPSLDLAAHFHQWAPEEEWLLCDSYAPVAGDGIVGCNGRVWTRDGRLLATGTSTLICRPNPMVEGSG